MVSMLTGFLVLLGASAMVGLATWMNSKKDEDDPTRIVWSIVQLSCLLVMTMGGFLMYYAHANPVKPPPDASADALDFFKQSSLKASPGE